MLASQTVVDRTNHIAKLMEERLGVRGRGLEIKLRRAGRMLPRWVQQNARTLVEAERLTAHPKLIRQVDPTGLDTAYGKVETWLKSVDPAERRKDKVLGLLATNVFNLLLVTAGFITWLVWAGHL